MLPLILGIGEEAGCLQYLVATLFAHFVNQFYDIGKVFWGFDGSPHVARAFWQLGGFAWWGSEVALYFTFACDARVMERQTCRSQKPMPKGVWVRIPPRAPSLLHESPS